MISIKPIPDNYFECPLCESPNPSILDIQVHSTYSMGECRCSRCKLAFFQTLPIGHCVDERVSIRKSDEYAYPSRNGHFWLTEKVLTARKNRRDRPVSVRKVVHEERKQVVVLNTLDFLYGHVLLKLFNYQYHLRNNANLGLVVIVPKAFEWLVPAEASEVWIVDLPLSELAYEHTSLTKFFRQEFERFDSIWLSRAWSHPEVTAVDMKQLTGIAPFNLDLFTSEIPTFTFVLRDDRWWLRSGFWYGVYRAGRRLKSLRSILYSMVSRSQERLVRETIRTIRKSIPDARFFVTGLGDSRGFKGYARDVRSRRVDEDKELEWCRIYAHSHVVIGFHGSNMLLPTAFAAGCVEVLPEDRYGNILQDVSVRYSDRRMAFFYRFADQYASPDSVAAKAVAMVRDYDLFHRNMCINKYPESEASGRRGSLITKE